MHKHTVNILLTLVVAAVVVIASMSFVSSWFETPPDRSECRDRILRVTLTSADGTKLVDCFKSQGERFYKADFADAKDLSEVFLTLVSALFVASITFSEKIVGLDRSGWWSRSLMILSWTLLLASIIASGVALVLMTMASSWAIHEPVVDYWIFERRAMGLYLIAGISFGSGLASMLVTGALSLIHGKERSTKPSVQSG